VKLSIDSDPLSARTCWCTDCQKFGGGNGTTNAFFPSDSVSTSGEVTWYESIADSGNTMQRAFCTACGSPVFTSSTARPELCGIRVSILDDRNLISPEVVIWTDSAPDWAVFDENLPHFPKAPPAPQAKE